MKRSVIAALLLAAVTMFLVCFITFFMMNAVPGGPFNGEKAKSPAVMKVLNERYGLDKPVGVQFVNYMKNIMHGDFGVSLKNGIKLVPTFTVEVCKHGEEAIVDYDVSDVAIRDNNHGLGLKVTGRLTNNTSEATNSIDVMVVVVFFDKNGEILDIGYTYANEMAAGGKTSFEVTTLFGNKKVKKKDVADYKVIARGSFMQF